MKNITQAVILAGGIGTRLRPLTYEVPKPMVLVNGRPYLEYLVQLLKMNGISEIVLLLGYLPEKVTEHFGDGSDFGVSIKYSIGDVSFETGTRIRNAAPLLDDKFLLMYCDNYWPLDLEKIWRFYSERETIASVTVYTNKNGITKNNILVDETGYVLKYDKSRQALDLNGVEIGFFILDKRILDMMPQSNFTFEKVVIPQLIAKRQLCGYQTDHRYYSASTPERLAIAEKFLQPRKVVFLDRDGVINRKAPEGDYIKNWAEFEFLPGAIEGLEKLTSDQYDIFLITNQAGIARGMMSEQDLHDIHMQMKKVLAEHNVKLLDIYYCPHGWDDGCECRKPKPGMLYQAARDYDLNLTKAFLIGDDPRDLQAGNAAGCRTIMVARENPLTKIVDSLLMGEI